MDKTLLNKYLLQTNTKKQDNDFYPDSNIENKFSSKTAQSKIPDISTIQKIEILEADFDFFIKCFDWLIIKFVNDRGLMTENFFQIFSYKDIIIEFTNFEKLILNLINFIEIKKIELQNMKIDNVFLHKDKEKTDLYTEKIKEVLNYFIHFYSYIKDYSISSTYIWFHKS